MPPTPPRHICELGDIRADALANILDAALARKNARAGWAKGRVDADAPLAGRVVALIFEKPSTRTRVSFDIAMRQLGGGALVLEAGVTQLGRGETIADTARVLSRMVDAIVMRTDDHAKLAELAHHASVPVINGLTNRAHPCQIVADLLTLREHGVVLAKARLAWLGDGNNVLASLIEAAGLLGFALTIAGPAAYAPDASRVAEARARGATAARARTRRDACGARSCRLAAGSFGLLWAALAGLVRALPARPCSGGGGCTCSR